MKIILIGLAAVGGLVVLVGVIGRFLPATRTASAQREVGAASSRVWAVMTDLAGQPAWRPDLEAVRVLDAAEGAERWVEQPRRGPAIEFRTTRKRAGAEWEFVFSGPAEGRWAGRLEPLSAGRTRVVVEEAVTVTNPWKRVPARLFFNPQAMAEGYLAQLAAAAESAKAD
jgi:hypothetical protein